jgi:membrane associated rhomboid family serine protease
VTTAEAGGIYGLAPAPAPVAVPRDDDLLASAASAAKGPPRTCPSCEKKYPGGTKICVECGVNLATGRPVLMTDDASVDRSYTYAEAIIRWISWIFVCGVYPIASEGFGLRKPWATRGIATVTIVVSVWFMIGFIYNPDPEPGTARLMLWCGRGAEGASAAEREEQYFSSVEEKLRAEGYDDQTIQAAMNYLPIETELEKHETYQLLTHALLHDGPIHLLGNLLFLMVFGSRVNALIGNLLTLIIYPVLAIMGGVAHMVASTHELLHPMLGASGAIMGLAGMYLVLFPVHKVHMAGWWRWGLFGGFHLHLKLFDVRGFWVVLFYIAFDVIYTAFGLEDGTAHWAHLGGFLAGVVIALILLVARLANARGGDILTVILGRHAWALIGKPNRPAKTLW